MNLKELELLENEMSEKSFSKSNKGLKFKTFIGSIIGNILSAFFCFVFLQKSVISIDDKMSDYILFPILILLFIIVVGFEFLKRDIFRKIVVSYLNKKNNIGFISFGVIILVISAWLSIHGASELANKTDNVKTNTELTIKAITDSTYKKYELLNLEKLKDITSLKQELSENKSKLNNLQLELNEIYNEKKYADATKTQEKKELIANNAKIEKSLLDIEKLISTSNKDRDLEVKQLTTNLSAKLNDKISNINKNQIIFILLTSFIELLIIFGVAYSTFYDWKSYNEIITSKSFEDFKVAKKIIDLLYHKGKSNILDKLPTQTKIIDSCLSLGITNKLILENIELFENLKIIKPMNQQTKILNLSYLDALKEIENYYKF